MSYFISENKLKSMKGLSPLISMVLVIAFGFTAMTIVLTVVNPMLDRAKDSGIVNEATQNMQLLDSAIKAVASEARGSKRTIHIKITEGVLRSNGTTEQVYLEYEPRTSTILDGFSGDVKIESRSIFLEYFNKYNTNDNANDTWTVFNGSWSISSSRFLGTGGIAYHNVGNQQNFDLAATIVRSSTPDGQVYAVPGEPKDLILYLPFDGNINTSETTAYDYSAYKINGTLSNATVATCFTNNACPSWVIGKFGNATNYDGVGDYVDLGTSTIRPSNATTVAAWIKAPTGASNHMMIVTDTTINTNGYNLNLVATTGYASFIINDGSWGDCQASGTTNLKDNSWHFLAGVYNGTHIMIYVDATLKATDACQNTGINYGATPRGRIAAKGGGDFAYFNGIIDEVMVFNRSLTANEVAFLYESSWKKITIGGEIPTISPSITGTINTTIVLASPGSSYFDNIKLKSGPLKIKFTVPYQNIDIVNNTRFGPGDHNIVIRHYGTNTTTNRPMIGIEE